MTPTRGQTWLVRDEGGALRRFTVLGERPHVFASDMRVTGRWSGSSKSVKVRLARFTAALGAELLHDPGPQPAPKPHRAREAVPGVARVRMPRGMDRAEYGALVARAKRLREHGMGAEGIAQVCGVAVEVVVAVLGKAAG